MNEIILSILIPSIPKRYGILSKLASELYKQKLYMQTFHSSLGDIEIIIDGSERFLDGGLSIGKKREKLVTKANGNYLCFLDDDEQIAPNYIETLVRMCNENKDVCTFRSLAKLDNYWTIIDMRLGYPNDEANPNGIVKRNCWHVCPVRSKYAKLHEFDDINYGEDWKWFEQVLTHCETEAHTDAVIHSYQHSKLTSESDNITKHLQDAI